MSSVDKKWISAEITTQLRELKTQLNKEIVEDLKKMQQAMTEEIIREVMLKINAEVDYKIKANTAKSVENAVDKINATVDKKIDRLNNQMVIANDNQISITNKRTQELVLAVGQQVCNTVYGQVIGEINEKIVPKVNNMVQWVNYNMQDGGEVVDKYRRAVETQHRADPSIRLITDGAKDDRIITEHVRTFFSESD